MKFHLKGALLLTLATTSMGPCWNTSLAAQVDLAEAYRKAISAAESVAISHEEIIQAEERLTQARAGLFPTVYATATQQTQETPTAGALATSPSHQSTVKISAVQPLFRGLREFAALRLTSKNLQSNQENFEAAKNKLFVDVATSYYLILFLEKEIDNQKGQIELIERRLKELRGRIRIGRSKLSEALSVESSLASNQAELISLKSQLLSARETFAWITQLDRNTALTAPRDENQTLESLNTLLAKLEERPDIRAAKKAVEAADEEISIARGEHLPSLDLNGNYYLERPGLLRDVHWDVQLVLTIPLFAGGASQSKVREAHSNRRQAELREALLRRQAEAEVRSLYEEVTSSLSQINLRRKAAESAEKDYSEQLREYRLGLINNLQLLQVQSFFQESQLALERTLYNFRVQKARLEAALGPIAMTKVGVP